MYTKAWGSVFLIIGDNWLKCLFIRRMTLSETGLWKYLATVWKMEGPICGSQPGISAGLIHLLCYWFWGRVFPPVTPWWPEPRKRPYEHTSPAASSLLPPSVYRPHSKLLGLWFPGPHLPDFDQSSFSICLTPQNAQLCRPGEWREFLGKLNTVVWYSLNGWF